MDELLLIMAEELNDGALLAPNSSASLCFAPGVDSNPLQPLSNPVDIAMAIAAGEPNSIETTVAARDTFVAELQAAGRIAADERDQWLAAEPTRRPVVIAVEADIPGDLRFSSSPQPFWLTGDAPVDHPEYFTTEFISLGEFFPPERYSVVGSICADFTSADTSGSYRRVTLVPRR